MTAELERAKRTLLRVLIEENKVEARCFDHTTCMRWALGRADVTIPKELR